MENSDLSDTKKNLFDKAFSDQNKNKDMLTTVYDKSGEMFRDSLFGKLFKKAATSDFVKKGRNKLLDISGAPEHYKQYAKYLSGGTVGNKEITELPENIKKDVVKAHFQVPTDERPFTGYPEKEKTMAAGINKGKPNPDYNPESTRLQLYDQSDETAYTLGNVQFKPDKEGGYTLTDTYDVDDPRELGVRQPYKPFRQIHSDLLEGGRPASILYDVSKFLGLTGDMKYNVKFDKGDFK
tara:strand:+ start:1035 stop:1748 length:714 start_codon:yes stop_codon:yes gene_type:complete